MRLRPLLLSVSAGVALCAQPCAQLAWESRGVSHWRDHVRMVFDSARGVLVAFGGQTIGTYRALGETWELAPNDPARVEEFGAGCPDTAHRLVARALPWTGASIELAVEGFAPGTSVIVWCGFSDTSHGGTALPLSLAPIGLAGCHRLVSPDVALAADGSPAPTITLALPNAPALVGERLHLQAFGPEPTANALGVAATSGTTLTLGAR